MKNFIEVGDTIPIAVMPEAADSGEFIKVGELCGVAVAAYQSGAPGILKRTGVFELPKVTGTAWLQGQKLYWDAAEKKFTHDASKSPVPAIAWLSATDAAAIGKVLLATGPSVRMAAGQVATVAASDTIATGLAKVLGVVATLNDAPADDPSWVSADVGDQNGAPAAGSFLLKTWKNTSGTDPTPVAATTFAKKVNWIAFGL